MKYLYGGFVQVLSSSTTSDLLSCPRRQRRWTRSSACYSSTGSRRCTRRRSVAASRLRRRCSERVCAAAHCLARVAVCAHGYFRQAVICALHGACAARMTAHARLLCCWCSVGRFERCSAGQCRATSARG
jgi:hypothetical protein